MSHLHKPATLGLALILGTVVTGALLARASAQDKGVESSTYEANCAACHQSNGQGLEGAFPPLAGHAVDLFKAPEGRTYLIRTILWGVEGPIVANAKSFDGQMPPWNSLSDAQIAATINYVLMAWGNDKLLPPDHKPISSDEIAAARKNKLTAADVYRQRPLKAPQGDKAATRNPVSFTRAQAERGETFYLRNCLDCHGPNLDDGEFGGAPLKGSYFREHWASGSVAPLFAFTKAKMPPNRPGGFDDQSYADVIAYILSRNDYKAGDKELPVNPDEQQKMSLAK